MSFVIAFHLTELLLQQPHTQIFSMQKKCNHLFLVTLNSKIAHYICFDAKL